MDGFIQSVGSGISGLVVGSLSFIGQTLRGIVAALDHALPGGLLAGLLFVALAVSAWQLARR
jgi:hypothetical protein